MRIAYILGRYPSPTETFIAREIEELRRQGFEIRVLALEAGEGAKEIPRSLTGKLARKFGGDPEEYWKNIGRTLAAGALLEGVQHIHAGWANELSWIAWAAAESKSLPWSFSAHARDLWVEAANLEEKLAAAKFAAACTKAGAARLREVGPPEKVLYAPHGLDLTLYPWKPWQPNPSLELLCVGRLVEKKGWNLLLQILPLLASAQDIRLTLIGEGPARAALQKQAKLLKIQDRVTFTGPLPHPEVIQAMQRADCLVLPSRVAQDGDRDGLANVLLEGAALGIPLVTTDAGSATDFVDESTGALAKPDDPADLLRAIAGVFAEPEITVGRCKAALRRVEEEFELGRNVGRLGDRFCAAS